MICLIGDHKFISSRLLMILRFYEFLIRGGSRDSRDSRHSRTRQKYYKKKKREKEREREREREREKNKKHTFISSRLLMIYVFLIGDHKFISSRLLMILRYPNNFPTISDTF